MQQRRKLQLRQERLRIFTLSPLCCHQESNTTEGNSKSNTQESRDDFIFLQQQPVSQQFEVKSLYMKGDQRAGKVSQGLGSVVTENLSSSDLSWIPWKANSCIFLLYVLMRVANNMQKDLRSGHVGFCGQGW